MSLNRELFHSFRGYDTSKDLWRALQKRFEGNSDIKKSKRDLLRKQYECFRFLENESLDDLISRFYHLQMELKAFELNYPDDELVEKFLDALPPKFEMYTTLIRENPKFYELTVDEAIAQQDENFDWGIHLEDAIISQTHVGLMAEIMELMEAERKEAMEKEAEEMEASVADLEESITAVALMAIGEGTSSSSEVHLDVAYRGLEKRNNEINKLQNEILQLKCTNEKLKYSRFVVEHYESVVRKMNGLGRGTNSIPPPISGKFVNGLLDIDLTCLDESSNKDDSPKKDESSSKANSTSSEEFVTASEDGSVNSCREGVVSEELLTEQKVKKNIITNGDNCILTEPDVIKSNDKLKVMLYGGYKNLNQVKKEAFSAHFGLGYKENLEKYCTPKNQTVKVQTAVQKPTPPAHKGEFSKARSNEPYKRTYVDKRNCFHCGLVGHIFVNCPSKNQGKRPVVSQPAVIPRSLPVKPSPKHPKQNVVKPPVQPMAKPKIKSEAKPSVARKVWLDSLSHREEEGIRG
ncbi:hypothetical protein L1987_15482 [Smallanthus sonchifolius]|uniref:Uncharacterized protein n=1 Tax=Smallanthus sonchifolius TaxID=185202 RepID=A0ACB9J7T7_9ASTR|nr:hypothetical protein L1987_15482 [Smallanthus sonchifolius]